MRAHWKCDMCPTIGHLSPRVEQVKDETGKPIIVNMLVQDNHTGKMYNHPVVKTKDLDTRISIVQLRVGDESCGVQLCKECLDKFRPKFMPLWLELEKALNA